MCISPAWKLRIISFYGKTRVFLEPGGSEAQLLVAKPLQNRPPCSTQAFCSSCFMLNLRSSPGPAPKYGNISCVFIVNSARRFRKLCLKTTKVAPPHFLHGRFSFCGLQYVGGLVCLCLEPRWSSVLIS